MMTIDLISLLLPLNGLLLCPSNVFSYIIKDDGTLTGLSASSSLSQEIEYCESGWLLLSMTVISLTNIFKPHSKLYP